MRKFTTFILVATASSVLAGCSDPKKASEDNFRSAIEPMVADAFCRPLAVTQYRLTEKPSEDAPAYPVILGAAAPQYVSSSETQMRNMLEAAAKEGLLTRTEKTEPAVSGFSSEPLKPTQLITYQPTEKGKDIFRGVAGKRGGSERPNVCFGRGKVDEVVRWTEPADALGQTMTQVTYTYSGSNFPDDTPKEMVEQASKPKEAKVMLVKMSDGWQVMK